MFNFNKIKKAAADLISIIVSVVIVSALVLGIMLFISNKVRQTAQDEFNKTFDTITQIAETNRNNTSLTPGENGGVTEPELSDGIGAIKYQEAYATENFAAIQFHNQQFGSYRDEYGAVYAFSWVFEEGYIRTAGLEPNLELRISNDGKQLIESNGSTYYIVERFTKDTLFWCEEENMGFYINKDYITYMEEKTYEHYWNTESYIDFVGIVGNKVYGFINGSVELFGTLSNDRQTIYYNGELYGEPNYVLVATEMNTPGDLIFSGDYIYVNADTNEIFEYSFDLNDYIVEDINGTETIYPYTYNGNTLYLDGSVIGEITEEGNVIVCSDGKELIHEDYVNLYNYASYYNEELNETIQFTYYGDCFSANGYHESDSDVWNDENVSQIIIEHVMPIGKYIYFKVDEDIILLGTVSDDGRTIDMNPIVIGGSATLYKMIGEPPSGPV